MNSTIFNKFKTHENEENAKYMKSYLKDKFEFLGIKAPLRKELQKDILSNIDKKAPIDKDLVTFLWNQDYREFQYLAIDYLIKKKKILQKEDMEFLEELITTKSWWDTVDLIDSHLVGEICKMYPELIESHILNWSKSENLWLRRTSILYQLKYKEEVDVNVLSNVICSNLSDTDFFIKKAIGWVLREYSKTNPLWVKEFVENHNLSPLSKREASKYLN